MILEITESKEMIKVFNHTIKLSKNKYNDYTQKSLKDTIIYNDDINCNLNGYDLYDNNITFIEGGTIETAHGYCDKYNKVAILNFADGYKPGGWPELGCLTQEENLCRTTNLYSILDSNKCKTAYYNVNIDYDNRYGLCTDALIYSPNILILKNDKNYKLYKNIKNVDVITCPAPSCRFNTSKDALNIYKQRINKILKSAIRNNVDCIILGAWGCGAFGQSKYHVAKAFKECLDVYGKYFKEVVFAIKPTPTWSFQEDTYSIFKDVIEGK